MNFKYPGWKLLPQQNIGWIGVITRFWKFLLSIQLWEIYWTTYIVILHVQMTRSESRCLKENLACDTQSFYFEGQIQVKSACNLHWLGFFLWRSNKWGEQMEIRSNMDYTLSRIYSEQQPSELLQEFDAQVMKSFSSSSSKETWPKRGKT